MYFWLTLPLAFLNSSTLKEFCKATPLSKGQVEGMMPVPDGSENGYGMAFFNQTFPDSSHASCKNSIGHHGALLSASSDFAIYPEKGIVVAFLSNLGPVHTHPTLTTADILMKRRNRIQFKETLIV